MAKIIELILTHQRRGIGKEGDPVRMIPQLWTKDGELVAEEDDETGKMIFLPSNIKD